MMKPKTLRIDLISCLPALLLEAIDQGILYQARRKGKVEIFVHNLRDYTQRTGKKVDDYAYGGGSGMVLQIAPIARCIQQLQQQRTYDEVIYMAPDGLPFTQKMANKYSLFGNLVVLCGRYKGVDERVRAHLVTKEISIGAYVLTGGELPALVFCDAITRLVPGVLGDETSALGDSFQDGMIAPPVYTRPASYEGLDVPEILLSGHEDAIQNWRTEQSRLRTQAYEQLRVLSQGSRPAEE